MDGKGGEKHTKGWHQINMSSLIPCYIFRLKDLFLGVTSVAT